MWGSKNDVELKLGERVTHNIGGQELVEIMPPKPKNAVTVKLGRSHVEMTCTNCARFNDGNGLWTPGNEGRWHCTKCGMARVAIATREEFREEYDRLLAMFAVWRGAYESSPSSALTHEATVALARRLNLHGIGVPLVQLLARSLDSQIATLAPRAMAHAPLTAPLVRDGHFGPAVTAETPGEFEEIIEQVHAKQRLEAMRGFVSATYEITAIDDKAGSITLELVHLTTPPSL